MPHPNDPSPPLLHRRRRQLPTSRSRTSPMACSRPRTALPRASVLRSAIMCSISGSSHRTAGSRSMNLRCSRRPRSIRFMALGPKVWSRTRARISELLRHDHPELRDNEACAQRALVPMASVKLHLPHRGLRLHRFLFVEGTRHQCRRDVPRQGQRAAAELAAYADRLQRPRLDRGGQRHAGAPAARAVEAADGADVPSFGPCKRLDFELEMGVVVGQPSPMGEMLTEAQAEEMIFGFVILNDWSARDIQQWEYVPLGPFQAKAFATSISPWVVTREALEPFRVHGPAQDPKPLPYLRQAQPNNYDMQLEVGLRAAQMNEAANISRTNFKYMYWSSVQQLVHHASSRLRHECRRSPGQRHHLAARRRTSAAACLRSSWNGTEPVELAGGVKRTFPGRRRFACDARLVPGRRLSRRLRRGRRDDPAGGVTLSPRHCGAKRSNPSRREKKEWIASSLRISQRLDSSALLRRNILEPRAMRRNILHAVLQMHALVRRRLLGRRTRPAAARLRAGSAAAQSRRRSSGRHCAACSRRNPRRTCIRRSRSAPPSHLAAGPCRNIRSSAGVAVPWWVSRGQFEPESSQIGLGNRMTNFPRFRSCAPRR